MLFCDIGIIDDTFSYRPHCWVGTQGDTITYLDAKPPSDPAVFGERYDGTNRLLMPGLFNGHTHAAMTIMRGYGEAMPLWSWLNERIWPFEAKMTPEDNYWGTLLGCAEMLRYGTVGFTDMYFATDRRFQAASEAGMKMNGCECLIASENKPYRDYPVAAFNERLLRDWHLADNGRLRLDICIHGEYTSNPLSAQGAIDYANEHGLRMHIHACETRNETEACKQRHNSMTPIAYFASLGMFENPTTAAHCVWLDDSDFAILRERQVTVATCPVSNMKLGSGFAPIARLLAEGVPVALGSDGCASNNNHDLFQDAYVMALTACGSTLDPAAVTPAQVLYAATRAGALAQGRPDCGLVQRNKKADLCVLDTGGPAWAPATDMVANVVYAGHGSDVCLTMVDGSVRYRDGSWAGIDVERAKSECTAIVKRIGS